MSHAAIWQARKRSREKLGGSGDSLIAVQPQACFHSRSMLMPWVLRAAADRATELQTWMHVPGVGWLAQVVCATCAGAGDDERLQTYRYKMVIIDEATQATEPSNLIPLVSPGIYLVSNSHIYDRGLAS